jgi:hypothetical protein
MNANKEDIGVLKDYTFDLAYGDDENDFECVVNKNAHCCAEDFFLYIEGTEYGGIVDNIGSDTSAEEVTYSGRTWHGILNSKILAPDTAADYLVLSGEANAVLASLIDRMGLNSLFKASSAASGIVISNYKMSRYIEGYTGMRKMLKAHGAKLHLAFKSGFVELSALPVVDYSKGEQFDKDLVEFVAKRRGNKLNHVVCLGQGELSERQVVHVYADENGNIVDTQVLTGLDEVSEVYENTNAVDISELRQGGVDRLKEAWTTDELDVDFTFEDESFSIGDIVGALDTEVGVDVRREIGKKIVKIENGTVTVSYPSASGSGNSKSVPAGGGSGGGCDIDIIDSLTSTSTEDGLSANQGNVLYNMIVDTKEELSVDAISNLELEKILK